MAARFYYCDVDENGVLCVDQLVDKGKADSEIVAGLATQFPDVIYFKVDNANPEFRVPR